MKIAVFGCSWSFGVPVDWHERTTSDRFKNNIPKEDYVNWTRELGKFRKDFTIYNYSVPGTCIEFSLAMLERYLKNPTCDITIFQATRPYRFTYWKENFIADDHLQAYEDNVYQFGESLLDYVTIVNHHNDDLRVLDFINFKNRNLENTFIKNYFKRVSNEMFENRYKTVVNYVKDNTDIFFSHEHHPEIETSIESVLGTEKFESFFADEGKHFGHTGAEWQAKWLLDKINTYRG